MPATAAEKIWSWFRPCRVRFGNTSRRPKDHPSTNNAASPAAVVHGHGKKTYPDGAVYEGEFYQGKRHGLGKYTWPNGVVHEGQFVDGSMHGQGKETSPDGAVLYEGGFYHWKWQGLGKLTHPNGKVYEGEFHHGKAQGLGKLTFPNGEVHEGGYWNGKQHGLGKHTFPDGRVCEGVFYHGKEQGMFKWTCPDGTTYEGNSERGALVHCLWGCFLVRHADGSSSIQDYRDGVRVFKPTIGAPTHCNGLPSDRESLASGDGSSEKSFRTSASVGDEGEREF